MDEECLWLVEACDAGPGRAKYKFLSLAETLILLKCSCGSNPSRIAFRFTGGTLLRRRGGGPVPRSPFAPETRRAIKGTIADADGHEAQGRGDNVDVRGLTPSPPLRHSERCLIYVVG